MLIGDGQDVYGEDEKAQADVLKIALQLADGAGGDDPAGGCGKAPQTRDDDLPADDEEADPGGDLAERDEHDQGGGDEGLVGQGVHELAEYRFDPAAPGDPAIDEIGQGRDAEDDEAPQLDPAILRHGEEKDQHRDKGKAKAGEEVRNRKKLFHSLTNSGDCWLL